MTAERPRTTRDHRIETLHDMLTRFAEAQSEGSSVGGGGSQHTSRLNVFDGATWTREYQELDRCLQQLKWLADHGRPILERDVSAARAWWHLRHRYLETTVVRREIHLRKTHSGERVPARLPRNCEVVARATILNGRTNHMLVRQWDQKVDAQVVGVGLRWISREFRGRPAVYAETSSAA